MEYRKLISFGKNSYVVSLPKSWIRQNKLEKGNIIYVDENKNNLVLHAEKYDESSEQREIVIAIDGKNIKRIQREIVGAHIHNYTYIKLVGSEIKEKAAELQAFIQRLIALEIVEQDSKKIIAKDFLNMKDVSFEQIIKKMALISKSMLSDCRMMFKEDTYESIYLRDHDINKFRFLVYRIVWYGLENPSSILRHYNVTQMALFNYWWFSFSIEQIGDCVKRIARSMQSITLSEKSKSEFSSMLERLEIDYNAVLNAYYKKDLEAAHLIVDKREKMLEEVESFFERNKDVDEIGTLTHNTKGFIIQINAIARIIYQGMLIG